MTSNCSPMKWFEHMLIMQASSGKHNCPHAEHVNTPEKMQDFADKLIFCLEHDVQITTNQVMVPNILTQIGRMHYLLSKELTLLKLQF